MRKGGDEESGGDTDDDVSSRPKVPSFSPPGPPAPNAPYESEKPPRRLLEPEYEDDE
jgi:hypothetical protein